MAAAVTHLPRMTIGRSPSAGGPPHTDTGQQTAMTTQTQTTLERAFELARTGKLRTVTEIRLKLRSEGFDVDQITGPRLLKQLNALLGETHQAPPADVDQPSRPE